MNKPAPTQALPPEYSAIGTLDLSRNKTALILLNLVGGVLLLAFIWLFIRLAAWLRPGVTLFGAAGEVHPLDFMVILVWILSLLAIQALVIVFHEGVHGFFFWWFTRQRPRFAFKGAYAYAALPDWFLPRRQYLVVALGPLVVLSLVGTALMTIVPPGWLLSLVVFIALNASGAVGDVAVAIWLAFAPAGAYAQDHGDAVTLFSPAGGANGGG